MASQPDGDPNHKSMAENRRRVELARFTVVDSPPPPYGQVAGTDVVLPHLNLYLCNGGVVVPLAGAPTEGDVLQRRPSQLRMGEVVLTA